MSNIKYIIRKCTATGRYLLLLSFLWMQTNVLAQNEQILKGRIVDSKGNPVAGAVINIAEQSSIALSDKDGYFSLKNVKPQDELCVSSVGYLNATTQVNFKEGFQIVLSEDLDEYLHTMPVPFGRKAKKLMTEATSVVTGEELQKHPITILQNAFTATVNGMETY